MEFLFSRDMGYMKKSGDIDGYLGVLQINL